MTRYRKALLVLTVPGLSLISIKANCFGRVGDHNKLFQCGLPNNMQVLLKLGIASYCLEQLPVKIGSLQRQPCMSGFCIVSYLVASTTLVAIETLSAPPLHIKWLKIEISCQLHVHESL